MDIAEKSQLLAEMLEVDVSEIQPEAELTSFDMWDSMAALSLIALLEEHFGRADVDGGLIRKMKKIADVFNVMEK
ncbi:acyl carrier protein [Duganella fentianensis]|uniref:acyl carrier protein n=1 Tax=Duganella fentianensis TaxID=2692177 RepID=UPI0032B20A80